MPGRALPKEYFFRLPNGSNRISKGGAIHQRGGGTGMPPCTKLLNYWLKTISGQAGQIRYSVRVVYSNGAAYGETRELYTGWKKTINKGKAVGYIRNPKKLPDSKSKEPMSVCSTEPVYK